MNFTEKPWFRAPLFNNNEKMMIYQYDSHVKYIKDERQKVEDHEKLLGLPADHGHGKIIEDADEKYFDTRIINWMRKKLYTLKK